MEMQILVYGIALPVAAGLAWIVARLFLFRSAPLGAQLRLGAPMVIALALSSWSQESPGGFPAQNKWLWFPCAVLACGLIASCGAGFARTRTSRMLLAALAVIPASLLLDIPEWKNFLPRVCLGIATTLAALLLARIVRLRNIFSTTLSLSFALAGTSILAMVSGFAKLAVPLGAAAFFVGFVSLLQLATRSRKSGMIHFGFDGAVAIAAAAALGSATGFGYDTNGIPAACWVLSALAPLGLWLGEPPAISSRASLSHWARIAGCVAISAAAIAWAVFALNLQREHASSPDTTRTATND